MIMGQIIAGFVIVKYYLKNAREYNDDDDYYQNKTESQILKELYTNYLYNDENNFDY